ncbi:MAG: hypothetical protein IKS41_05880 [Alphaproteobacteria bacterium]|nr:hypothetical protein [Alphaproteobacteria bacterium]
MNKTCAFLGNATLFNVKETADKIRQAVEDLISHKQVDTFLVGTKGEFENLSHKIMEQIQFDYPNIKIMLVIAYVKDLERCPYNFDDVYYPTEVELSNKRWSISRRNEWIIEQIDYIIACNQYKGRAYDYCRRAMRKGKEIIEIGEQK